MRTPGRAYLALPTAAAAQLVADEFDAQGEILDIPAMPVLRLANTALDGVAQDTQAVLEDILRYASCDPRLLPRRTVRSRWWRARPNAGDAVIDWARASLSARMVLAEGVMHVDQPREGHRRHRHSPQCPQKTRSVLPRCT